MKTNYQINDSVTITKLGMFYKLHGKVLSNNTDTKFMPLTVILDNNLGVWSFNYADVELTGKEKPSFKADVMPWEQPEKKDSIDNLTVATKPAKRAYNKKPKNQPKKEKRKYTRRIK